MPLLAAALETIPWAVTWLFAGILFVVIVNVTVISCAFGPQYPYFNKFFCSVIVVTIVVFSAFLSSATARSRRLFPFTVAFHFSGMVVTVIGVVKSTWESFGWGSVLLPPIMVVFYEGFYTIVLARVLPRDEVQAFEEFLSHMLPGSWVHAIRMGVAATAPADEESHGDDGGYFCSNSLGKVSEFFKQVSNYDRQGYQRVPTVQAERHSEVGLSEAIV